MEVPQLVIRLSKVYQHDGGVILRTSQLGSCANAVKLDPGHVILMRINDKDCLDELVAFLAIRALALRDNVPFGFLETNNGFVTVCSKVLPGPGVRDFEGVVLGRVEDPLHINTFVKPGRITADCKDVRAV